jgi:hypothetical protein
LDSGSGSARKPKKIANHEPYISFSKKLRWVKHIARMGNRGNAHAVLVGKPDEKRPLRKPSDRWQIPPKWA